MKLSILNTIIAVAAYTSVVSAMSVTVYPDTFECGVRGVHADCPCYGVQLTDDNGQKFGPTECGILDGGFAGLWNEQGPNGDNLGGGYKYWGAGDSTIHIEKQPEEHWYWCKPTDESIHSTQPTCTLFQTS